MPKILAIEDDPTTGKESWPSWSSTATRWSGWPTARAGLMRAVSGDFDA